MEVYKEEKKKVKKQVYLSKQQGGEWTIWKEDESGCRWEYEIVLEGGEYGEWGKSGG